MHCLKSKSDKASATEMMDRLAAAGIRGVLRYHPDGRGQTTDEYAVYVEGEDTQRALHALGDGHPEVEDDVSDDKAESCFVCPRCERRRITLQEERSLAIMLLSLPLLGLPLLIQSIYVRNVGSKKSCDSCRHIWRSRP